MMPHTLQTNSLSTLRAWAIQHHRNEIQDTILRHAPDHFSWDDCDQVEEQVLSQAKKTISTLTIDLLKSLRYMNHLIDDAAGETRRRLQSRPGALTAEEMFRAGQLCLGGHPKPASRGHLKTGQLKP